MELVKTGIDKLDAILGGGIPERHLVLVSGTPGTMKTSLALQVLYRAALDGRHAAYLTLEQSGFSVVQQMELMGYDMGACVLDSNDTSIVEAFKNEGKSKGVLSVIDIGLVRRKAKKFSWMRAIETELQRLKKRGLDIVVLDSLNVLYTMERSLDDRSHLYELFDRLKELGVTALVINEVSHHDESRMTYGFESYLVDGIVNLFSAKRNLKVKRELHIEKMRYVDHSTNIFVLEFKGKRFTLSEKMALE